MQGFLLLVRVTDIIDVIQFHVISKQTEHYDHPVHLANSELKCDVLTNSSKSVIYIFLPCIHFGLYNRYISA